ncbi:hypothetical protein ALC62_01203 [Cyphomyrmex costatus]|uniref:CCHC-type domain-containing protein n=1 Tax=Cyphomyrmex costatus TaxID=456900 RepID=A0A151IPE2_9HYME|nr:hypothetical protein ALC62_01203 [Cyphomyrmex costatus]
MALAANRLVANDAFAKYKIRIFIPTYKVLRTGIIKGVDQSLSLDCIKDNIKSSFKIIDIQRLNRRTTVDGQAKYSPSRTLCIKFAGQVLPEVISLFHVIYHVEPYVPKIRICYVCYRVGHIGKDCKSSRSRCLYCSGDHDKSFSCAESMAINKKCINCGGDHLATSFDCPTILKYKEVINMSAHKNIPHIEAKRIVSASRGSHSSTSLPPVNPRNFPYLAKNYKQDIGLNTNSYISQNRFSMLTPQESLNSASHMPASYAEASYTNEPSTPRLSSSVPAPFPRRARGMSEGHHKGKDSTSLSTTVASSNAVPARRARSATNNVSDDLQDSSPLHGESAFHARSETDSNFGPDITYILDVLLSFLDKIKQFFGNNHTITTAIDHIAEFVFKLMDFTKNLNIGVLLNLFNFMGFGLGAFNASTGQSQTNSCIHQ